jgi:hypothetical protein
MLASRGVHSGMATKRKDAILCLFMASINGECFKCPLHYIAFKKDGSQIRGQMFNCPLHYVAFRMARPHIHEECVYFPSWYPCVCLVTFRYHL